MIAAMLLAFSVMPAVVFAQNVPPPPPTGLSASLLQSGQIYVTWSAPVSQTTIVGYYVYRDGVQIASTPGFLFYTDNAPAGTHVYTVTAYDQNGSVSQQATPTTPITVLQDTAPTAPTGLTLVPSSSSVALSWSPATDNIQVIGYYIYRNGVKVITPDTISGTTFTDVGLAPGYTYTYVVGAYNAQGYITRSAPITVQTIFDITPPSAPQYLKATAVSPNEIDLTWNPSYDTVAVVGYNIYRDGTLVVSVNNTSTAYQDVSLSPGTTYTYAVAGVDEVGNISQQSIPVSGTTFPPDITPPSIPSNLTYTAPSTSEIDLAWKSSTDNVAVAGYYVYRDGNQIGSTQVPSYVDTGLATATTYTYAVKAYDTSNNISPQQSIAATTPLVNPIAPVAPIAFPVVPSSTGSVPYTPPTAPNNPSPSPVPITTGTGLRFNFTTLLYVGMRGVAVSNLQGVMIAQGYLAPQYATGYFGLLTQRAVQAFQCAKGIVCSGSPFTNGYGLVGVRTRAALNAL